MKRKEWVDLSNKFSDRERELLIRSYDTITTNIYEKDEYLWSPYRCITPGKVSFDGIWNWDSAFHAIGVSRWDTSLARDSISGFLKFQKKNGLLPDVVRESGNIVDTFSKPPLFPWAVETIYKREPDTEFLKSVYPKLVLNEAFWVKERCYEGLFFYDAENRDTDDYLIRVKYESGWDNSPRWDKGITEYWAIDLNCFMVMFYRSMSFLAKELCLSTDAATWNTKAETLGKAINEKMWDSENQYYSDTNKFTEEVSSILSPASFMPLYIGIAPCDRAKSMCHIAEERFKSKMPTVPFDSAEYSNNYWRGPTWLNVAYFAAKGLKNYGFEVADSIKESILEMCHREKRGIYENYDSLTGEGLGCDHFSWSCVFINEFILNFEKEIPSCLN